MDIEEYSPKSTLVVPENIITKAKYPFVDIHNHIWNMPLKDLSDMVKEMDSMNMAFIINLSGSGSGAQVLRDKYFSKSILYCVTNGVNKRRPHAIIARIASNPMNIASFVNSVPNTGEITSVFTIFNFYCIKFFVNIFYQ